MGLSPKGAYTIGLSPKGEHTMPRTLRPFSPHSLDICLEEAKPQYN